MLSEAIQYVNQTLKPEFLQYQSANNPPKLLHI